MATDDIHIFFQEATNSAKILKDLQKTIAREENIHPNPVKFHDGGFLGKTSFSVVWKGNNPYLIHFYDLNQSQYVIYLWFVCISGDYKGQPVAYKLTANETAYKTEIEGFAALNAINNPEIEKCGIPNAYVYGNEIKHPYWGIGMTLFDENLEERWGLQQKNISELSILLIFKRGVKWSFKNQLSLLIMSL